jgi:hypothetical protein
MNSGVNPGANVGSKKQEPTDNLTIPVWLHATGSLYKKLNRSPDSVASHNTALSAEDSMRCSAILRFETPRLIGTSRALRNRKSFVKRWGKCHVITGQPSVRKRSEDERRTVSWRDGLVSDARCA